MESQKKRRFFENEENLDDDLDEEVRILRKEIKELRKDIHNLYKERWQLLKERIPEPVRYETIQKMKKVNAPNVENVSFADQQIKMNLKIHEYFGSYAEWVSENEIILHLCIPSALDKIERYSVKLMQDEDDLWNVIKCNLPTYISTDVFNKFSKHLSILQVRDIVKKIRDTCFSYENRKKQFEIFKNDFHNALDISVSPCYRYIDILVRLVHTKNNETVNSEIKLTFPPDGIRPQSYEVKSEDLSKEEILMLKKQLKPLFKYDLLHGFQISMMKKEESMFLFYNSENLSEIRL